MLAPNRESSDFFRVENTRGQGVGSGRRQFVKSTLEVSSLRLGQVSDAA
jgi:hypothetical protein